MRRAPAIQQAVFSQAIDLLGPFERRPHVAVAVSGGADSMALVLAAAAWARARGGRVTGLTVDHGLRAASAAEARQVRIWLRRHGIAHAILRWRGDKPSTGVQAAARDARYALLENWCRDNEVLHLLLAHHREDLLETARLRAAAGSGPLGLAGISSVVERPQVRLLRPLLRLPKSALQGFLNARGQAWLDDPSNLDRRFARGRMRSEPPAHPPVPVAQFGRRRAAIERTVADRLARAVDLHPAGWAWLAYRAWRGAPSEVIEQGLGRVLATIGGATYAPASASLRRLAAWLYAGETPRGARTLGGCRLIADAAGGPVLVCREAGRMAGPRHIDRNGHGDWDSRYVVNGGGRDASLEALGPRRLAGWDLKRVPAPARAALPVIVASGGALRPVDLPGLRPVRSAPAGSAKPGMVRPGAVGQFRPQRPLAGAPFMPAMPARRRKKGIV
ncbi:MAG: tRNA lysidine(34) synthetase TilS [Alphaproteobacteria bacterium]